TRDFASSPGSSPPGTDCVGSAAPGTGSSATDFLDSGSPGSGSLVAERQGAASHGVLPVTQPTPAGDTTGGGSLTAGSPHRAALRVRRFDPGVHGVRWDTFSVPLADRSTILDALFYVLREQDRSISFRCACRAAMCGSCAMVINGQERLACKTPLASLRQPIR